MDLKSQADWKLLLEESCLGHKQKLEGIFPGGPRSVLPASLKGGQVLYLKMGAVGGSSVSQCQRQYFNPQGNLVSVYVGKVLSQIDGGLLWGPTHLLECHGCLHVNSSLPHWNLSCRVLYHLSPRVYLHPGVSFGFQWCSYRVIPPLLSPTTSIHTKNILTLKAMHILS